MPELLDEERAWFVNKEKIYELLIDYKYVDFNAARNNDKIAKSRKEEIGFDKYKNSLLDRLTLLSVTSLCNDNDDRCDDESIATLNITSKQEETN